MSVCDLITGMISAANSKRTDSKHCHLDVFNVSTLLVIINALKKTDALRILLFFTYVAVCFYTQFSTEILCLLNEYTTIWYDF